MIRAALVLALLAAGILPASAQSPAPPGRFDYWVLALSWSPSFCVGKSDPEQCHPGGPRGFVVHGLWPQYDKGGYPASCAPARGVPDKVKRDMLALMPSRKLIDHEWAKHGTCSGLDAEGFFDATSRAAGRVVIPPPLKNPESPLAIEAGQVEALFARYNPGLKAEGMALACKGRRFTELRLCLDRDFNFRSCGPDLKDRCRGRVEFPSR